MKANLQSRTLQLAVLSLSLSGCQQNYKIGVSADGGQLVFHVSPRGIGQWTPRFSELEISSIAKPVVIYWRVEGSVEVRDIVYGHAPTGMKMSVEQKPLVAGQLYRVAINPLGPGMAGLNGDQGFVIADDGYWGTPQIVRAPRRSL